MKVSEIPTMAQHVVLLGHLFIHRLAKFTADTDHNKFSFERGRTMCKLVGASGLKIPNLFLSNIRAKVSNFEPHLLLIDIRTHHCHSCDDIGALAKKLFNFASMCMLD